MLGNRGNGILGDLTILRQDRHALEQGLRDQNAVEGTRWCQGSEPL